MEKAKLSSSTLYGNVTINGNCDGMFPLCIEKGNCDGPTAKSNQGGLNDGGQTGGCAVINGNGFESMISKSRARWLKKRSWDVYSGLLVTEGISDKIQVENWDFNNNSELFLFETYRVYFMFGFIQLVLVLFCDYSHQRQM